MPIKLVGNVTSYTYQKVFTHIEISKDIYQNFVASQQKTLRTIQRRHAKRRDAKNNYISEMFAVLTIILIAILIAVILVKVGYLL